MSILKKWDEWCKNPKLPYILITILFCINILFILLTDIFPFQDMPQHLSYARIMADYGKSGNLFDHFYNLTAHFSTYHTYHWILSWLSNLIGIDWGFKFLLLVYFVTLIIGLSYLMNSLHENLEAPIWNKLLIQQAVWNATIGMGFMPFVQSMPFFAFAIGAFLRIRTGRGHNIQNWSVYLIALIILSLTHVVTSFSVLFFIAIYILFDWSEKSVFLGLFNAIFFVVTSKLYGGLGQGGLTQHKQIDWAGAFVHSYEFEFVTALFNITWSPLPVTMNYVFWNFVGAYRLPTLIPLFLVYCGIFYAIYYFSKKESAEVIEVEKDIKKNKNKNKVVEEKQSTPEKAKYLRAFSSATKIFLFVSIFMPWGIYIPSEITFINYRLLTLALFLLIAIVPFSWSHHPRQKLLITLFSFLAISIYCYKTFRYQDETKTPLRLISRIPANKMLGSVVFGNKSEYFAKILDVTHFLPMFYTIRHGGLNGQFWACYAPHLPVCYKEGKGPSNTPDWHPWKFKPEDLNDADYLLYSTMYYANNPIEGSQKQEILARMDVVECADGWCLYKKK